MDKLNFISLNVKGLRSSKLKRMQIFRWCTEHNVDNVADVLYFQETHSSEADEKLWSDEWGGNNYKTFYAHGNTNSRGVCIIIKSSLITEVHSKTIDSNGRFLILDITLLDRRITLCNVYAPNEDDPIFISDLMSELDKYANDDRLIGGDFNCILDETLDKSGGSLSHANKNMGNAVNNFISDNDLMDIWRHQHGLQRCYTYHCKYRNEHIFTRLDFFLISFGLSNYVDQSHIKPSILTDHSMISVKIAFEKEQRGRGYWKLNCSFLSDLTYVENIKTLIQKTQQENPNLDPLTLWEFIKVMVRGETIKYGTIKKRSKINLINVLSRRLDFLERQFQENPTDENKTNIVLVKQDIKELLEDNIKGSIMRSKIQWIDSGEKPTSFFLGLEKRNFNKKNIKRLRTKNEEYVTNPREILVEIKSFFMDLYSLPDHPNTEQGHIEIEPTYVLSGNEREICEGLLTEQELFNVLKSCKNNKTPGSDGFPAEFYKTFWDEIKSILTEALNFAFENNKMSPTQREGIITLLPKKEKDTLLIKNWRPITLLNQDYKLATKAIAKRLCGVLPSIINTDQTGFIKGRYIGENILKLQNLMDYADE